MSIGPYETEIEALAGPVYREVHAMHESGRYRNDEIGRVVQAAQLHHLAEACKAAGVELGAFDQRILSWLAGWEASTVQVIIGLIARANGGTGQG